MNATTNAAGSYAFDSVLPGNYVLRPAGGGYAFTPTSRGVTVGTATVTNLDFRGTPDTVGPVVVTTQPTAKIYRELTLATGTVTDDASGVAKVTGRLYRFANGATPSGYWSGGENSTTTYSVANELLATGTSNWVLNLPSLPTGAYTFRATAWDNAGNRTYGSVVSFSMDTSPPQVQVTSPINTNYNTLPPGIAQGTAQDGESGLARVTVRLFRNASGTVTAGYWAGGTTWTTAYTAANEILASGTANWSASLPSLPANTYIFRATAKDNAGNVGYSSDVTFTTGTARLGAVQAPSTNSPLSSASASVAGDSVTLVFSAPLSSDSASPLRFSVEVNGHAVAVQSVTLAGGDQITLILPEGSLSRGANVQVSWSKLQTAQRGALADGSASTSAK